MKRFDRAMYAFFLLALLADVARARVPAPVGGDAAGGLMLSAAGPLCVAPAGVAGLDLRHSDGSLRPKARYKSFGWTFSRWARTFSQQTQQVNPLILLVVSAASLPDPGSGAPIDPSSQVASPSLSIFAHLGSPAP